MRPFSSSGLVYPSGPWSEAPVGSAKGTWAIQRFSATDMYLVTSLWRRFAFPQSALRPRSYRWSSRLYQPRRVPPDPAALWSSSPPSRCPDGGCRSHPNPLDNELVCRVPKGDDPLVVPVGRLSRPTLIVYRGTLGRVGDMACRDTEGSLPPERVMNMPRQPSYPVCLW